MASGKTATDTSNSNGRRIFVRLSGRSRADLAGGVEPIELGRTKGKQTFQNVTRDLLFVDVCIEFDATTGACTKTDQIPLFSDDTKSYLWQYDNDGLRLAQLRFYEIRTVTGF